MRDMTRLLIGCVFIPLSIYAEEALADGAAIYQANCLACHQTQGQGIANVFPSLVGSDMVTGDPNPLVKLILVGRGGMPAFQSSLDDKAVVSVVNYIRNSWGNSASELSSDQLAAIREQSDKKIKRDREQQ